MILIGFLGLAIGFSRLEPVPPFPVMVTVDRGPVEGKSFIMVGEKHGCEIGCGEDSRGK